MRSKRNFFIWLAVLAAVAASMSPAVAKKPDRPEHPDGLSCVDYPDEFALVVSWDADSGTRTFRLEPPGRACLDVRSGDQADYRVEIVDSANLRNLAIGVRDSHPGDFCAPYEGVDVTNGLTIVGIPASTVDACGNEYTDVGSDPEALAFTFLASFRGNPAESFVDVTIEKEPSTP
jgi:hypothetical protein